MSPSRRQGAGCFHLVFAGGVFGCRLMFPSAQAELTSGHYRSSQVEGLEARVDLASQVLQLNVPEEKQFKRVKDGWRPAAGAGLTALPRTIGFRESFMQACRYPFPNGRVVTNRGLVE